MKNKRFEMRVDDDEKEMITTLRTEGINFPQKVRLLLKELYGKLKK